MTYKTAAFRGALSLLIALVGAPPAAARPSDWEGYKARFISPEGRVVDTGNKGISHSEGQGYGMLLATHHRDKATFVRLWDWTRAHLQVRQDRLFAWKWTPKGGVEDANDAADADVAIAWALLRAARLWPDGPWRAQAGQITDDVLAKLVRRTSDYTLLLPGAYGFEPPGGTVVNLSYWLFPAFSAFHSDSPRPEWERLGQSGHALLRRARFGRWGLPPDWLLVSDRLAPAPNFKPRFGYDAVRIPLYLLWAGNPPADLLRPFQEYWGYFRGGPFLPAWTDLSEDAVDSYQAAPGIRAIAQLSTAYPALGEAALPAFDRQQDYYSATLLLLSRMMLAERPKP